MKTSMRFAAPAQGLTWWTLLYFVLGFYGLYKGIADSNRNLLVPGLIFTLSSLGIWLGLSAARWLLFGFLVLMSGISLLLMASKGVSLHKIVVLLSIASCCRQLFLWNPDLNRQNEANQTNVG